MKTLLEKLRNDPELTKWADLAVKRFIPLCCAEVSLQTLLEACDYTEANIAPRMASGLCGGMSGNKGTCGAPIGAGMAIGLKHGRDTAHEDKAPAASRVSLMMRELTREYGSTNCFGLIHVDLGTDEGKKQFEEDKSLNRICKPMVRDAVLLSLWAINASDAEIAAATP